MAFLRTVQTEGFGTLSSGDVSFSISVIVSHDTNAIIDEIESELYSRFHDDYLDMANARARFEYTIVGGDYNGQSLDGSDAAAKAGLTDPDNTSVSIKVTKVKL